MNCAVGCGSRCRVLILLVFICTSSRCAHCFLWGALGDVLDYMHRPKPPKYPDSFEVAYNFTLPYERKYLPDGLILPVRVWRDEATKRIRMDTYDGVNSLISTEKVNLEISPHVDELVCAKFKDDPGEPGTFNVPILPDVSSWKYAVRHYLNGQHVHMWELSQRHGDKHTVYKFYSANNGDPVRLHMHGNDAFSGAHFDIYIADYSGYRPGAQDSSIFTPPEICKYAPLQESHGLRSFPERMKALLPQVHPGKTSAYSRFLQLHGRQAGPPKEFERRLKTFQQNAELIEQHNKNSSQGFSLALNKFADWSQEEFEAVMLPRHKESRGFVTRSKPSAALPYERLVPKGRIPGSVDWRGSLVNDVIKDQAACGSCWAFATTGVLEAAHYLATGKRKLFSEQQSMDCSWGYGLNKACDGGDYDAAMDYLKQAGGLIEEQKYEYLGADGFCRHGNFTAQDHIPFKGYAYVPPEDDEALMEAVYSRGPIAVSLDASPPAFRFYSGGILDAPNCKWKSDELDHAVLLVGYGTCPVTGKDYWLIKNSWSTYWGDKGYVKVARANHGCGIPTDPVYAVF